MAKDGFFYLGNLDRAQCFSCSGVLRNWAPHDNVREQHGKHFSNCLIVRNVDAGNIPMSDTERQRADREYQEKMDRIKLSHGEPQDPPVEEQRHLAQWFPCRIPVNPHMLELQLRIGTFDRWPKTRMRAPVERIAEAGFYYLGEGDKTKCFYCNGGLQNWDQTDEPWSEHAKWFPECEFVLRQKGVDFVQRLVTADPNLIRPFIRNPASCTLAPPSGILSNTTPQFMEAGNQGGGFANVPTFQRRAVPRECLAHDIENGRCFLRDNAQFANRDFTTAVSIVAEQESNNADLDEIQEELDDGEEQPQEQGEIETSCRTKHPRSSGRK